MSPEQARGLTGLIDERTDIYSLGVILYEAVAGEPPLMSNNLDDLLFRIVLDDPDPLEVRVPSVEPALAAIVRKAMAKNAMDRFQSADEMREAVAMWRSSLLMPIRSSLEGVTPTVHALPPVVLDFPWAPSL